MTKRKRPGAIYACYVRSPRTGRRVLGYVGKTRQWVKRRWQQHQDSQPWADTILEWRTVREWKDVSTVALWWAEVWYIVTRMPLYNIQWNRLNPFRVRPWTAQRQAHRRGRYVHRHRMPMAHRRGWRRKAS